MSLPTIFANLPTGNNAAALLDTTFNAVAAMGVTQCTATGTNTLALAQNANQTTISSYVNYQLFSFVAPATSTGSVTININAIGSIPLYLQNATSQAGAGSLSMGVLYICGYNSALNSGVGGAQIVSATNFGSAGQYPGTTTNDNANAGNIGEYISSSIPIGSAVPLSSSSGINVTTISLTAGDWDVRGNIILVPGSGAVLSQFLVGISTTSAVFSTLPSGGAYQALYPTSTPNQAAALTTGEVRISLASTTTVYLIVDATFSTSTYAAYGFIGARRMR